MNNHNSSSQTINNAGAYADNIENQNLKETMNPTKSPLIDYYISRYFEIHDYVIEARLSRIDEEILKCQNDYQDLMSREDHLAEIASRNKEIQEKIEQIDLEIKQNKAYFMEKQNDFSIKAESVTAKENNLLISCNDYYQNILSKLSQNNFQDTMEYVEFVLDVLKYTSYNEVVTYLAEARIALKQLDELNDLEVQVKKKNMDLIQEKETISSGLETISFEETEKKLDALAYEITNKKKSKEELANLFSKLKKQNVKNITDEIRHFQILEYNQQQIAMKMDEMVLDYKNSLAVVDTSSNILFMKELKLKKLHEQLEVLQPLKDEYESINDEYNQLVSMHQTISRNINDIEEFISQSKKVIEVSQDFKQVVKHYSDIKNKKAAYESNYSTLRVRLSHLVESRKSKLNDPYGKIELIKIDEEIKNVQESLESFNNELLSLNNELCQLKDTEQDFRVIAIYDDYTNCEEQLPTLYEQQREFSVIVNDKYVQLSNLKLKVAKYDEIANQIEELENEINNI
jgi:hypothetical protein